MLRNEDFNNYLLKQSLKLPEIYTMNAIFSPLKCIWFPNGCLKFKDNTFTTSRTVIDTLSFESKGFAHAVSILAYYFAVDTIELKPEFSKSYQAVIISGVETRIIDVSLLDKLKKVNTILLVRNLMQADPRYLSISWNENTLLQDLWNNSRYG